MSARSGLVAGTAAALALAWAAYVLVPGGDLVSTLVQTGIYLALLVITARSRRVKIVLVRALQRWMLNPLFRGLLAAGLNPLGLAILETRGRVSGLPRRTPVGNGRRGNLFWIIAEHGWRANYVQNITADPRVRVRLRIGRRYRWVSGTAMILAQDDPLARQRRIIAWHPLRTLNAINVRVLGADLLTVQVRLDLCRHSRQFGPANLSEDTDTTPGSAEVTAGPRPTHSSPRRSSLDCPESLVTKTVEAETNPEHGRIAKDWSKLGLPV